MERETLLLGGESGSGKTHTVLTIARYEPDAKFRIIEPDNGVKRLLNRQFSDLKNVDSRFIRDWLEFKGQVQEAQADVKANKLGDKDWIILEGIDIVFQYAKYDLINAAATIGSGNDRRVVDSWESIKAKRRKETPILEPSDWDGIYSEYEGVVGPLLYQSPCNIIATCAISLLDVGSRYENKWEVLFYTGMGMNLKFEGYKRNPRMFDTLIMLSCDSSGYYYTIARDRGSRGNGYQAIRSRRQKLATDFYLDYLVEVAGREA